VAAYSGDANNAGSASAALAQVVNSVVVTPTLDLTANPTSISIVGGQEGMVTVAVSASGAVASTVTFTCTGLPADSTCTFSPASLSGATLPATVTMTIQTTAADALLRQHRLAWQATFALILPGLLILPAGIGGRRRKFALLLLLGVLTLMVLSFAGCCGAAGGGVVGLQSQNFSAKIVAAAPGANNGMAVVAVVVKP
jgi:hypothetical protein